MVFSFSSDAGMVFIRVEKQSSAFVRSKNGERVCSLSKLPNLGAMESENG